MKTWPERFVIAAGKPGELMESRIAQAAVSVITKKAVSGGRLTVVLSGEEPLARFDFVSSLVKTARAAKARALSLVFEVPTSGEQLHLDLLAFLRSHPEIELLCRTIRDPALFKSLPSLVVEIYAEPFNVDVLPLALARALSRGFCRLMFTPAYFAAWGEADFKKLDKALATCAALLSSRRFKRIDIRNLERTGPLPFYKDAFAVDRDGNLYCSGVVLASGGGASAWKEFKMGSVLIPGKINWELPSRVDYAAIIKKKLGARVFETQNELNAGIENFFRQAVTKCGIKLGGAPQARSSSDSMPKIDASEQFRLPRHLMRGFSSLYPDPVQDRSR